MAERTCYTTYFSTKTYVVGTQKNRLNETVLLAPKNICLNFCLFVCFVALRPKSTAMVMAGRSVHYPHFFLGKLEQAVNQYFVHILSLVTDNNPS